MYVLAAVRKEKIEAPFFVFPNKDENYTIHGLPDIVPGIAYRSQKKSWMIQLLFA